MAGNVIDVKVSFSKGTFTDGDGAVQEYDVFNLILKDWPSIPIRFKPADSTGKEILKVALGVK